MIKNEFLKAEDINAYRMIAKLYCRLNEATFTMQLSQDKIYKEINTKITEAIRKKMFPPDILSKWNSFLSVIAKGTLRKSTKKLDDEYNIIYPDLPDMISSAEVFDEMYKTDSLTELNLFWQKMLSTRERREFIFELYFSIMGRDKKLVQKKKYEKYFYYCWYDKITDAKIVNGIRVLHDKYSRIEKDVEDIRKNIQRDLKMPPCNSFAPVTLMIPTSGQFTEENTWFVPIDMAISSFQQKNVFDEEDDLFDNPFGFKKSDRLYLQINVNYDKQVIWEGIDNLLSKISKKKGTERGKGKRQSAYKDEQEKLIEEKFIEYYVDKKKSKDDSLFAVSIFLESKEINLKPGSIGRRYIKNIVEKYGVASVKGLRKIDRRLDKQKP